MLIPCLPEYWLSINTPWGISQTAVNGWYYILLFLECTVKSPLFLIQYKLKNKDLGQLLAKMYSKVIKLGQDLEVIIDKYWQ